MWGPTWEKFLQQVQRVLQGRGGAVDSQSIASSVYAAAKLRQQPQADELQLLVQAFLQRDVQAEAGSQDLANLIWALSKLCQLPGWQGGITEQDMQQLLGEQQLALIAADSQSQDVSNVLVALVGMSGGPTPLVSAAFAKERSAQILSAARERLVNERNPQTITNTLWACGELGLVDGPFAAAVANSAPAWIPQSTGFDLTQAATACASLQYKNEAFVELLLQRAFQLVQQQPGSSKAPRGRSRVMSAADKASLAALLATAIVQLDMQQLAGPARQLVAGSGVGRDATHPADLRRLWLFHSWLLQHQLLDGKGLTGILTQQQLQQGKHEAAVYGTGIHAAQ